MKKVFALLLALAVVCLLISGCSKSVEVKRQAHTITLQQARAALPPGVDTVYYFARNGVLIELRPYNYGRNASLIVYGYPDRVIALTLSVNSVGHVTVDHPWDDQIYIPSMTKCMLDAGNACADLYWPDHPDQFWECWGNRGDYCLATMWISIVQYCFPV